MKTILLRGRIDVNTRFILKRLSKFCSETKAKIIQDRISLAERHFGQLCDDVASFTRKCARLRDKGKKNIKKFSKLPYAFAGRVVKNNFSLINFKVLLFKQRLFICMY